MDALLSEFLMMNPLLQRLSVASLEMVAFGAAVATGIFLFRIKAPRFRALLWLVVIGKPLVTLMFGAGLSLLSLDASRMLHGSVSEKVLVTTGPGRGLEEFPAAGLVASRGDGRAMSAGSVSRFVVAAWCVGVVRLLLGLIRQHARRRRLVAESPGVPAFVRRRYETIGAALGLRRLPPIAISDAFESPALTGMIGPTIVLPAWLVDEGDSLALDWSLRHELTHLRMKDHWAAQLVEVCRTLFFFHPFMWFASRVWREAAEMACDRSVVDSRDAAADYATELYEMIVRVRNRRQMALAGGMFATRTQIGRRIEALLRPTFEPGARLGRLSRAALLVFAASSLVVGADVVAHDGHERHSEVLIDDKTSRISIDFEDRYDDGRVRTIHGRGMITFSDDKSQILEITRESRLEVSEKAGGIHRRVIVTGDSEARPVYTYTVDGDEATFDEPARQWLGSNLRRALVPPPAPPPPDRGRTI